MTSPIAERLDGMAAWRMRLGGSLADFSRALTDHDLADDASTATLEGLHQRLSSDQLVLAFVAEFSRGKSELINAIFFADSGRRVLPATPGRTTMCPVELRWTAGLPPRLSLLPIETRLRGLTLAELRGRDDAWQHVPLQPRDAASLAEALAAVTQTRKVSLDDARALGFWSDDAPDDNPPRGADGSVEVPAWRHALINHPHPLLQAGLVVIDTPGLNAIGAEPELTLGLLPSAHAAVFVLAADVGVTRSDLAVWRQHLSSTSLDRFVVLNKIDTLADPLSSRADVQAQIERQRLVTASTLDVPAARVFPLSARDALAAKLGGDADALAGSRLPALEAALADHLLPQRQALLVQSAVTCIGQLRGAALRKLADRRRQHTEQLFELRGLRGKSATKLRLLLERVDAEVADFERCTARLVALRAVQMRMLRTMLAPISSDALRDAMAAAPSTLGGLRPFGLRTGQAFEALMQRLKTALAKAAAQAEEMRLMLDGSFRPLNADFGFAFTVNPPPSLSAFDADLDLIAQNYGRYLGIGQVWRLAAPGFAEQFRRLLSAKLRVVFERAGSELELWSKSSAGQVESQMRERRLAFARRRDALQRVQVAAGDLEQRIAEVEGADGHVAQVQQRVQALADAAVVQAERPQHDRPPGPAAEHWRQDAAA